MNEQKNKRCYIRRKKCLNDSIKSICNALKLIKQISHQRITESEIQKEAMVYAQTIEAACWSPHSRLTEENYQMIVLAKTQELCRAILKKHFPPSVFKIPSHIPEKTVIREKKPIIQPVTCVPTFDHNPCLDFDFQLDEPLSYESEPLTKDEIFGDSSGSKSETLLPIDFF